MPRQSGDSILFRESIVLQLIAGLTATCTCVAQEANAQESDQGAEPSHHNASVGAYYSTGDYGQGIDTSIYYFPFSYDFNAANWNFKVAVAHMQVSGLGNVLVNVGGIGRNDTDAVIDQNLQSTTTKGVGDTVLTATYQLPALSTSAPFIDLGFEVKLPTADENKGHGTGEADYGVQVDLYQLLGDNTLFATAGYKFRGQSILFSEMVDSAYVSLGVVRPFNDRWSYGLIYDYREAASLSSVETHELLPFVSWIPAPRWTLMCYISKGFTRDSADIAVGTQLSYRW